MPVTLQVRPERFALCRLPPDAATPTWPAGSLVSVTQTPGEVSIVCPADCVPANVRHEKDYRCLMVAGPLDLALTGILASLATPLAEAGIAIFPLATFDTDYLFVRESDLEGAVLALTQAGHRVANSEAYA